MWYTIRNSPIFLFSLMNVQQFLIDVGLTEAESKLYLLGLTIGTQATSTYAKKIAIPRSTTQVHLDSLVKKGFMQRSIRHGIQYFVSYSGERIKELLSRKERDVRAQRETLDTILHEFLPQEDEDDARSDLQLLKGQKGLIAFFQDVIAAEAKEILFFRSPFYDLGEQELKNIISMYLKKIFHAEKIIKTLTSKYAKYSVEYLLEQDKEYGIKRCFVDFDVFSLPIQVIIYGKKVGILVMKKELTITIFEEENLAHMLEVMFEYMWKSNQKYHKRLLVEDKLTTYLPAYQHYSSNK